MLDASDDATVQRVYKAEDFDFRLKPGSAGVNKGTPLAGVTDRFSGSAPDLGALEVGQPALTAAPGEGLRAREGAVRARRRGGAVYNYRSSSQRDAKA